MNGSCALIEDETQLVVSFSLDNGNYTCTAFTHESDYHFVFKSYFPIKAPENKRLEAMEFITRANYGAIIGNFEMDISDGEITYKTSLDVEGAELTETLILSLVVRICLLLTVIVPG
jgi:hypothetical protein